MEIDYWDCKYNNYEEFWDGEEEGRVYGCTHPNNPYNICNLSNKWMGKTDYCDLLATDKNTD